MASVIKAMEAKSDQLNYVDIGNSEKVITITEVQVKNSPEQPVSIFYDGCDGKPYKPSKGMVRLLAAGWGDEADFWVGKSIKIYGDQTVRWAGKEVGGIRIRAMSDIDKGGINPFVALSRSKRVKVHVECIDTQVTDIEKSWVEAINAGTATLEQIEDVNFRNRIESLIKSGV